MIFDLHTHTRCSDGALPPGELLARAIDQGVEKARGSFKAEDAASAETTDAEGPPEGAEGAAESDDLVVVDIAEEPEASDEADTT
jgi:histidinol phosphatase-like PHP family hydrolase